MVCQSCVVRASLSRRVCTAPVAACHPLSSHPSTLNLLPSYHHHHHPLWYKTSVRSLAEACLGLRQGHGNISLLSFSCLRVFSLFAISSLFNSKVKSQKSFLENLKACPVNSSQYFELKKEKKQRKISLIVHRVFCCCVCAAIRG